MQRDVVSSSFIMANYDQRSVASTHLLLVAVCVLIVGCTASRLSDDNNPRLARLDEKVVKGLGIVLYAPQPVTWGPQRIVVALTAGSRIEMSNVSAVQMTYQSPAGSLQSTVSMLPVGDYMDAFGAVIPFTESGVWQVSIQVYRVGSVPAMSMFEIVCCGEPASGPIAG